ncbi:MAG: sulfurtransferase TusA family protein [Ardenticatenaceae bacterium]|nr:sulfurtransferase TusA family protein [Ardenticatenaceae bacterium]MCB9443392.1 sulfurtransferase TusA family protein [Ardenticatenaceae bacterium]
MTSLQTAVSHKTIDLSGQRCPNLVLGIIKALAEMENGRVLQIIATDPNAPSNVAAWSRQAKHQLIEMYEEDGKFIFYLRKRDT